MIILSTEVALYLAGLVLYSATFVITALAALFHVCRSGGAHKLKRCTVSGIFYVLVGLFLGARISWCVVELFNLEREYLQFGLNVFSDCLFFSCFSLIVIHWAESNSKTTLGDVRVLSSLVGWVFLAINVILYVFQIATVVYIWVKNDSKSPLVLTSILVAVLENLFVGVAFLIFGSRLYCLIRRARLSTIADPATTGQRSSVTRTLLVTVVMTSCFLTRSILYIVQVVQTRHAAKGDKMMAVSSVPRIVFIYLSELAPILYQLWLQRARKKLEEKHDQFIENLYIRNEVISSDTFDTDPLLLDDGNDFGKPTIN